MLPLQNQVAVRLDGRIAATAGWDGTVRLFDLRKELRPLAELRHHRNGAVHAVAFATRPPDAEAPSEVSRHPSCNDRSPADPCRLCVAGRGENRLGIPRNRGGRERLGARRRPIRGCWRAEACACPTLPQLLNSIASQLLCDRGVLVGIVLMGDG